MPTKTIVVCSTCGKKSCDGGIWEMIKLSETTKDELRFEIEKRNYAKVDLDTIPKENKRHCTLGWGKPNLKNKAIGETVVLEYSNWVRPALVTLIKVEN